MRRKVVIISVLCLAWASTLVAQDPAQPPQAVGPIVGLSLIMTNKDGKGITTLRKDQLRVFEDKDEQTILSLEADERPVDCVLLVDSTGSLRRLYPSVIEAAKLLIVNRQFRVKYQSTHDASKKGFRKLDVKFVSTDGEKRNMIFPRAYYVGPTTPPGKKSEKK